MNVGILNKFLEFISKKEIGKKEKTDAQYRAAFGLDAVVAWSNPQRSMRVFTMAGTPMAVQRAVAHWRPVSSLVFTLSAIGT
jgi:hypothetical protein